MKEVELKDLVGLHKLTGVDFETEKIKDYCGNFEDAQVIRFCLDGKTYVATEDPSDGYRSCMSSLEVVNEKPKNTFEKVSVFGIMKTQSHYNKCEIIQFYDVKTAQIVLEVGTDNSDDYYPSFIAHWAPENLYLNQNK